MALNVIVKSGTYRNETITNQIFPLVKDYQIGKLGGFITVDGSSIGRDRIRVKVERGDFEVVDEDGNAAATPMHENVQISAEPEILESEEEVMSRLAKRFDILEEMTRAAFAGDVPAMIVSGPPGIGKSYGVETELEKMSIYNTLAGGAPQYTFIKGAMTPIGLYKKLYEFNQKGQLIVFDDCDQILQDDLSLNLLKAALDSGKRRRIFWAAESHTLRNEGIPDHFEFKGSVIFITNIKFDIIKSKKLAGHLDALQSRCHYLDLEINSTRDRFLRIKQLAGNGSLFQDMYLTPKQELDVMEYLESVTSRVREMSIRTALKIAQLVKVNSKNWRELAAETILRPVR